jgi:hypothetical protein
MRRFIVISLFLYSFATTQLSVGAVVYDSLPFIDGGAGFGPNTIEVGQSITLHGDANRATRVDVALGSGGAGDFVVRFYELNGPRGQPGSLIWESLPQTYPFTPPNYNLKVLPVDVPNVIVPDTFALIVTGVGPPTNMQLLSSNAPSIGTSHDSWFRRQGFGWERIGVNTGVYGLRINAIPEPTAVLMVLTALTFYAFARRKLRLLENSVSLVA